MTTLIDATASWDGTPLPSYPAGAPRVTILRAVIAPQERLDLHCHPVINAGVVLRGALTVVAAGGAERTFRAGEALVELVNTPHYGENRGDEEVELVMFYAGAGELPLSENPDP
ncbi:cupin domain-containing protein [Alistipes sp.]|uniref:cupin domain-containing protein n=1 Tax=Alistipes sp. TaxID=1872444 RepID=UPI003AF01A6C